MRSFECRNDPHRAAEMLEKLCEIVYCDTCLTNDGAQSAAIKFIVVRHDKLCERLHSSKDDVASFLSSDDKSCSLERLHTFSSCISEVVNSYSKQLSLKPFLRHLEAIFF